MPYRQTYAQLIYGCDVFDLGPNQYCIGERNDPSYGNCYNIIVGKPLFFDTSPVPCEANNTCTRVSTGYYDIVHFDGRGAGKQAINVHFLARVNTNNWGKIVPLFTYDPVLTRHFLGEENLGSVNVFSDMFIRVFLNRYYTPVKGSELWVIYTKSFITDYLAIEVAEPRGLWVYGGFIRYYSYEVSPVLLLPLDYPEYLKYPELRRAVAYSANNAHPGWNASDIINIAKQLFPDRPWAVADDRANKLYLYGLTADDITQEILELAGVYSPSVEALRDPFPADVRQAFVSRYKRQQSVQPP